MSVGQKLQDFYLSARETTSRSSSIAGQLSGGRIAEILDRICVMHDSIRLMEDDSSKGTSTLKGIAEAIAHSSNRLEGFRRIIRQLQILCVSIKIENARLGDHNLGFDTLADDVGKLAREIDERCDNLREWSSRLASLIRGALDRVLGLEETLRRQLGTIIDQMMRNLESLRERYELSTAGAGRLANRYDAVSGSIGEIIISLQFHDITRQQLEHVKETFERLALDCETGKDKRISRGEFLKKSGPAADILKLQRAQLRHARDELTGAVERIMENLLAVAANVAQIARETQTIVGNADEKSFLEQLETGFSSLSEALAGHGRAGREIEEAMGSVGQTLDQMTAFAADIESIGLKIKLLALNAIIKSAQIGEGGASLAVLAEGIQWLSSETCKQTDTLSEMLRSVAGESAALENRRVSDREGPAGKVDAFAGELTTIVATLREIDSGVASLQSCVKSGGQGLSREIEEAVDRVAAHKEVERVIDGVISELDGIISHLEKLGAASGESGGAETLQALASAYTMDSERQIHNTLAGANAAPLRDAGPTPAGGPGEAPASSELAPPMIDMVFPAPSEQPLQREKEAEEDADEFGDNVELF